MNETDNCQAAAPMALSYAKPRQPGQVAADVAEMAKSLNEYKTRAERAEYALERIGHKTAEASTLATVLENLPDGDAKVVLRARASKA